MPHFGYTFGKSSRAPAVPHPPAWTHDEYDPFPSVEAHAQRPVKERLSWLAESGLWAQEFISQCADLARQDDRLTRKLQDPKLADSPYRTKAVYRAEEVWDDMVQAARNALWTIAEADRAWQSLTPGERTPIASYWHTPPEDTRLVGVAWYGLALFETWPRRFRLSRLWVNDFPEPLMRDLNASAIWAWQPVTTPPDPFAGDIVTDRSLAREPGGRK